MKTGDRQAALEVAESRGPLLWQAPAIAYLASLQTKAGDLGYKETFQRALGVTQAFDKLDKHRGDTNIGKYKALVHIARYQAEAGDRSSSEETFRLARQTALEIPGIGEPLYPLRIIGEAQAMNGDKDGSDQTFKEAIKIAKSLPAKQQEIELGEIARAQLRVGSQTTAEETVRLILQVPPGQSPREQALGLMRQANLYLILGNQEAASRALQAGFPNVKAIAESPTPSEFERKYIYGDLARLAAKARTLEILKEALAAMKNDQGKVGTMLDVVRVLLQDSSKAETTQTIQQLAHDASRVTGTKSPNDPTLKAVAVIQAAAGDLKSGTRTADRIKDAKHGMSERAYMEMAEVLINKADWKSVQQVMTRIKQHWSATFETYREIARAQAKAGDGKNAADWAGNQDIPLAKAHALLGVAEGMMDYRGIEPLLTHIRP
jgi:hypothetical protein